MVGLSPGTATSADVKSFITVYKSCFSASESSGFDVMRCQNAADFLETSEGLGAGVLRQRRLPPAHALAT